MTMMMMMVMREKWKVKWRQRLRRAVYGGLALGSWLSELALSHTATLEWMGCSDGCLNRLIGLASREIRTDGWMDRTREEGKREQKSDKGRGMAL